MKFSRNWLFKYLYVLTVFERVPVDALEERMRLELIDAVLPEALIGRRDEPFDEATCVVRDLVAVLGEPQAILLNEMAIKRLNFLQSQMAIKW